MADVENIQKHTSNMYNSSSLFQCSFCQNQNFARVPELAEVSEDEVTELSSPPGSTLTDEADVVRDVMENDILDDVDQDESQTPLLNKDLESNYIDEHGHDDNEDVEAQPSEFEQEELEHNSNHTNEICNHQAKSGAFNIDMKSTSGSCLKLLPCLHITCDTCLIEHIQIASSNSELNGHSRPSTGTIFTCKSCGFIVKVPHNGIDGFRNFPLENTKLNNSNNMFANTNGDVQDMQTSKDILQNQNGHENEPVNSNHGNRDVENIHSKFFCLTCDQFERTSCENFNHKCEEGSKVSLQKEQYIHKLLKDAEKRSSRDAAKSRQISQIKDNLSNLKMSLTTEIEDRAQALCDMILKRRDNLLLELNNTFTSHSSKYDEITSTLNESMKTINDVKTFVDNVFELQEEESRDVLLNFHNEMSTRLLQVIHQAEADLEIVNLKLDIPEVGKEESHLEKLYGTLMQGNVLCENANLLASFQIDLNWPTGMAISKGKDFVIAGKTGALESQGKILFYSKNGVKMNKLEWQDNCIPYGIATTSNGHLLISDNRGRIHKLSSFGDTVAVWENRFKGSGRLSINTKGNVHVTSSDEKCVHLYSASGQHLLTFPSDNDDTHLSQPNAIATNSYDDIILADDADSKVHMYDKQGTHQFTYTGPRKSPDTSETFLELKCASSICCDPFCNILVADFTNDCIHLVSKSGQFFGYLLTKENGISCPTFVFLDADGRLFVGQYGGDIKVFQYLSLVKHA